MGNLSSLSSSAKQSRSTRTGGPGIRHNIQAGSETVDRIEYREFKIKIVARQQGITVRRHSFLAHLEGPCAPFHHKLQAKLSRTAAIEAAKRFIDVWHQEQGPRWEQFKQRKERRQRRHRFDS